MRKIYLAWLGGPDCDGDDVLGVYTNKEAARKHLPRRRPVWDWGPMTKRYTLEIDVDAHPFREHETPWEYAKRKMKEQAEEWNAHEQISGVHVPHEPILRLTVEAYNDKDWV